MTVSSYRLEDMVGGWFVGNFEPNTFQTESAEVAVKTYRSGDSEDAHFHKIATEITLVLEGRIRMCGREWSAGDIIVLTPGETTDFLALTDCRNVVVKVPGALNDKFSVG